MRFVVAGFLALAAAVGAGAWMTGDDTTTPSVVVGASAEVEPAVNPTPVPTPTPTDAAAPEGEPTPTPQASPTAPPAAASLVEALGQRPDLSTLVELLARSDLGETLGGAGPVTLFAPTDDAFAALDAELLATLETDDAVVQQLLGNHVVAGLETTDDLARGGEIETVGGDLVAASDVRVSEGDIDAGNGVIHVVSEVLIPEAVAVQLELNALVRADPIEFAAGATELVEASLPTLDAVAAIILDHPDLAIELEGHTDTDGDEATNEVLSAGRAEVVRSYLIGVGVPDSQLTSVGYGESELIVDPEVTPEDKARNRRIEFRAT